MHQEPGVPTLARMMQVWLICPCGTNLGFHGSDRHAKTQLLLKRWDIMASLALISHGRNLHLQQCLFFTSAVLHLCYETG